MLFNSKYLFAILVMPWWEIAGFECPDDMPTVPVTSDQSNLQTMVEYDELTLQALMVEPDYLEFFNELLEDLDFDCDTFTEWLNEAEKCIKNKGWNLEVSLYCIHIFIYDATLMRGSGGSNGVSDFLEHPYHQISSQGGRDSYDCIQENHHHINLQSIQVAANKCKATAFIVSMFYLHLFAPFCSKPCPC